MVLAPARLTPTCRNLVADHAATCILPRVVPIPSPEFEDYGIVLRGSFNPGIFQPSWFSHQGLIPEGQASAADISLVNRQIAVFRLDTIIVQVTPDLFSVGSDGEPVDDLLRDLVIGTFRVLRHTPLTMVGVNRNVHLQTESEAKWHEIGHSLAPKEFWTPITKRPGTQSLTIRSERPDSRAGHVDITVQPSARVRFGLFIGINDHIQLSDPSVLPEGAAEITDALEANWDPARQRARSILEHIGTLL